MKRILFLILLYSQFVNAQWIQQQSNNSEKLTDVVMLDSSTVIAVGYWNSILKTTDTGNSWINLALPLSSIIRANAVSFFDKNVGSIACDYGVVTTTNQLKNWQWKLVLPGQRCLSVLQLDPENIYVGTDSGWIYNSIDSGKTWTSEKIGDFPVRSIFAWQGAFIESLPIYALTSNSLFSKMEFPSGQWEESALLFHGLGSEAFDGEFCNGGGPVFIVGVQGDLRAAPTVLRKSINDTVWRSVSSGILGDGVFLGVSAPSANVVYVCGSNGMIFRSSNGGDSWTSEVVPITKNINAIYFYDETHGFAVGDSGVILYTSNGGLTSVGNRESYFPTSFILYQNYPNPFNPSTKIKYTIPALTSFLSPRESLPVRQTGMSEGQVKVILKVYDILGNEVTTLVNKEQPPESYEVEFDGSKFSSGIYFYVLKAGKNRSVHKMCLIK